MIADMALEPPLTGAKRLWVQHGRGVRLEPVETILAALNRFYQPRVLLESLLVKFPDRTSRRGDSAIKEVGRAVSSFAVNLVARGLFMVDLVPSGSTKGGKT